MMYVDKNKETDRQTDRQTDRPTDRRLIAVDFQEEGNVTSTLNPHKFLLYKPTLPQLINYISSGIKVT